MAGLQLVAESLTTSLDVPGSLQQLNFTQNVAKLGINNSFSPVAGGAVNSIQIETSNNNLSGFRWIHETANATAGTNASIGTLRLCNFLNGDTVGQPLMSFDSIGNVTFAKNVNFGGSTGVTWASLGTPSAPVDFGGQKLLNVGTGSAGTDGVNLGQIQTLFNNLTLTSSKITDFSTAVTAFRLDQFAVPTSALSLNNQKITGLLTPTANQDAATKAFVDSHTWLAASIIDLATTVKAYTLNSFAAPTTSLNLNNQKISSLLDPVAAQDGATKNYVDTSTITTSRITDFTTAVTSFRLDQFAAPTSNLNLNNLRIVSLANPVNAQDAVTKTYVDTHTWLSASITDLATTVKGYSLSSFAAPTASLNLNSQKITNLLDPTTAQDAATKNYVDGHTWTTSQITDFASAVQTSLNTINLTGAITGTLQAGNTIPTLQSATQSFNFWRQTMTWSPTSGTNPSPTLPSGTPYYAITHVMPDNSTPPYYFHEAKVGNRTARLVLNPGLSSTQTGQFFFEYINSDLSIDTIPFQIGMNSGSPLITIAALTNFSSNRILNVGTGTATTDGVNLGQVQTLLNNLTLTSSRITDFTTAVTSFRLDQFAIPTSNLNLNNLRIINLANPTNAQDGVTKTYVDGHTWLSSSITDLAATVKTYPLNTFAIPTASLNLNSQKITNLLDPVATQDAATKNYIDNHTWTTSQITNFTASVTAFRLDQFAAPTTSINMNSQKITSLLNPVSTQDAATKIYVDNHTWTTSQITDFASAVQTSLNTINLTGAVTGTLQAGNTIPTLQSATQSFNFWRQTMTWSPASGTNPSPTLPSGTPYYAITHVMPDNSTPPYYFHEAKVGNRTARLVLNPGLSSTQTGQFFFEYINSDLSIDTIPFQIGMNSGSPLITIAALTNFSSNRLLNVGTGTATTDGVNLGQVQTLLNNLTLTTSRITDFTSAVTSFRLDQFAPPQSPLNLTNIYFNNLSGLGIGTANVGTNRLTMASSAKMIVLYDGSGNDDQANFNGFGIATGSDTSGNPIYSTVYNTSKGGGHLFYTGTNTSLVMELTGDRAYIGSIVAASDFRKIVFNENANNQNQTTAIGVAPNMMRFQVPVSTTDFVFYSGVNATTSTEVARIKGTGDVSLSGTFYGRSPSGSMGMQSNTTTTSITTAGSWVKVAGATTSANLNQWTMPSSNRLTYGGTPSITSFINVYLTASQNDTSMAEIKFALYKNGVQISTSVISTQMTMSILSSLSFGVLTSVATNDYFELYVSHPVASRTVLVKNLIITTTQT